MVLYERNNDFSSNLTFTFDFGKRFANLDCHSLALDETEKYLLLVGNHELQFINFETFAASIAHTIDDDNSIIIPSSFKIIPIPISNNCPIHRPYVQWNRQNTNQFALAVDRLARVYNVDHNRIQELISIVDTHHQRPISTIAYWPSDPYCLLTGSLDGQVQVWDIRNYTAKMPANLKLTLSAPFSVRHIQWSSMDLNKSTAPNGSYQLALQCDRSIRIYDMRRTDSYVCSIEHNQRIISMDWTMQNQSLVTLSMDSSLRLFSSNGSLLAESIPTDQLPFGMNKIRSTFCDNLFVCSSFDSGSSIYGFTGWRSDDDQYLRPLTDHILSTSPSSVDDFTFVTNTRFLSPFHQIFPLRSNDGLTKHFPILTWCRDQQLRLIDMDLTFRKVWHDCTRTQQRNTSDLSNSHSVVKSLSFSNIFRQKEPTNQHNSIKIPIDINSEDELIENGNGGHDDNFSFDVSSPITSSMELSENSDDHDTSISADGTNKTITEVSIENEFNTINDTYGPFIIVEAKNEQHRVCILRCTCPFDHPRSFRIYVYLSRHYPVISQLFVRFKLLASANNTKTVVHHGNNNNNMERLKSFEIRIQTLFDETSNKCFYYGQLCLHKCFLKLKQLFDVCYKQERLSSSIVTIKSNRKQSEGSLLTSDLDSPNGTINNGYSQHHNSNGTTTNGNNHNGNATYNKKLSQLFDHLSSPSLTYIGDSQTLTSPSIRANPRTCGARFSGGTYLICFGRASNLHHQQQQQQQQSKLQEPTSAPPILNSINEIFVNRQSSAHMRSTSISVAKVRINSSTDEQSSSYRSATPITNTSFMQHMLSNSRTTIFSAPVRLSLGLNVHGDHQRMTLSPSQYRRPMSHHLSQVHSTVSIYDMSILLPISKKLADDYRLDLDNLIDMCEANQQLTERMAKAELAHCWRLLGALLNLQSTLPKDHSWFQTPIAQGLIQHLVSHYFTNGDIQSATMFLLTMLETSFMKLGAQEKLSAHHSYDPVLYGYANLLHRWKHFYKRTQILYHIDCNCQPPATINQTSAPIRCSICLQPVMGQHVLCAICAHGGHLNHMHSWFASSDVKHRRCPEKDCSCRCVVKQQELLTTNIEYTQKQHHTPVLTPRPYGVRSSSISFRT